MMTKLLLNLIIIKSLNFNKLDCSVVRYHLSVDKCNRMIH